MGHAILISLIYLWVFWAMYVLVMGIYRAHLQKRLNVVTTVLSVPFVLLGYIMDIVANLTFATVVFFEWPREWLVTTRMKRYINEKHSWRCKLSSWVCDHLLDMFDPSGNHC